MNEFVLVSVFTSLYRSCGFIYILLFFKGPATIWLSMEYIDFGWNSMNACIELAGVLSELQTAGEPRRLLMMYKLWHSFWLNVSEIKIN